MLTTLLPIIVSALPHLVDIIERIIPGEKQGEKKLKAAQDITKAGLQVTDPDAPEDYVNEILMGATDIINGIVRIRNARR